ncbi:MAG: FAD-binding oxidoreductase, partial [Rhodobacter sp.]|nr:FAD-binding oxidoreductase [Rhodobacter sp.]
MAEQIIVVGAGIIGATIAFRLAERGAAVTVIDRALPAAGASGTSFGWINANFAETAEYYRLRRSSIDAFRALAGQLDLADHLRWEGCLWWEDEGDDLVRHAGELAGFGYEASVIGAAQFAQLEPHVANPPVASIRSTIEGAADAAAITRRLLAEAARHGASIVTGCEMQGLTMPGGRVTGVATSLGAMRADRVVIAAGAATGALLDRDGIALPMANKPGI